MTDAPPHPLADCLTQIIEHLCQAIAANNRGNLVTRFLMWRLCRWLRKLAAELPAAISQAAAAVAARANLAPPAPCEPGDAPPDVAPREVTHDFGQDTAQDSDDAPAPTAANPAAPALAQARPLTAVPAERSADHIPAGTAAAPARLKAACAAAPPNAGRPSPARHRIRAAAIRGVRRGGGALGGSRGAWPPNRSKTVFRDGISHALFVALS